MYQSHMLCLNKSNICGQAQELGFVMCSTWKGTTVVANIGCTKDLPWENIMKQCFLV